MPITRNRQSVPFFGRTNGGQSLRQTTRGTSIIRGVKDTCIYFQVPTHSLALGPSVDITATAVGAMIWDDGTSGTAWTTGFPGIACSVTLDTSDTTINSEMTVRLAGYDQFDRLVEEEISTTAVEATGMSVHAYKEVIQCELVSKGSAPSTGATLIVSGASDHDDFSVDLTGTTLNPSCRIGLPFIPDRPELVKAVVIAQASLNGFVRWISDNAWEVANENASTGTGTTFTDADIINAQYATMLLPAFTTSGSAGMGMGCIHLDRDIARETI